MLKKIGFEKVYENWKVKRLKGFNGGFFIFIEKGENMLYELKESMCKSENIYCGFIDIYLFHIFFGEVSCLILFKIRVVPV